MTVKISRQYWYNLSTNFGDMIGPYVSERVLGVKLPRAEFGDDGVLLTVGSILHIVDEFENPVVWGTGFEPRYGRTPDMTRAKVLAVRGPLTAKTLGLDCETFGDPALLLPKFFPCEAKGEEVRAIVHEGTPKAKFPRNLFDQSRRWGFKLPIISPFDPWEEVVKQICTSRLLFCESLHGAILAQAYGVPWVWWKNVHGRKATFKWHDWFSSIQVEPRSFGTHQLKAAEQWAHSINPQPPDPDKLERALLDVVEVSDSL